MADVLLQRNLTFKQCIIFCDSQPIFFSDAILDEAPKQMKKGDDQNKKDQKTEQEAIDETVAKCKLKVV